MSYYLPISLLKPRETYIEYFLDDNELGSLPIFIINNSEHLIVYLTEFYDITEEGKELLINNIHEILNEKYFINYDCEDFYEKYGYHDEGIIVYDIVDKFTVLNEYVGKIKFKSNKNETKNENI